MSSYVAGIPTTRWRAAGGVLAAGLILALLVLLVIVAAPGRPDEDLAVKMQTLLSVSDGFRASGVAVLTVVASSVLVLRITYAIVDRRELDEVAHVEAEQRFSSIVAVCCLFAVPFAVMAIPSGLISLDRVGECVGIIGLTGLSLLFAFGTGATWAPDARKQAATTLAAQARAAARVQGHEHFAKTTVDGHPALIVIAWMVLTCATAPLILGSALSLRPYDQRFVANTVYAVGVISLASWYGIFIAQFGRYREARLTSIVLRCTGTAFAVGGWLGLTVASVVTGVTSGWNGWYGAAYVFCGAGVVYGIGALKVPATGVLAPVGNMIRSLVLADTRAMGRADDRLEQLHTLIQQHREKQTPPPHVS